MFLWLDPACLFGDDIVKKPDFSILHQIAALCGHFKKGYCYPSQEEICRRVRDHHGERISRRTLNRHLLTLELLGFIKRVRRHCVVKGQGMTFRSTLYTMTRRATKLLAAIFDAAKMVVHRFRKSRVPKSAQYNPSRENHSHGGARNTLAPPPKGNDEAPSGHPEAKKQPPAEHIAALRQLLA